MRRRDFLEGFRTVGATVGLNMLASSESAWGAAASPDIGARLSSVGAWLGLRLTRYEHGHVQASREVGIHPASGNARLALEGATVEGRVRVAPARDRPNATDIEVVFHVIRGRLPNAAVAITMTFSQWSRDAYLFVPGAVYAGNRFASRHIPFPPLLSEPSDIGPHVPPIISDIPRLNIQPGESQIILTAADTAVPAIGVRLTEPASGSGFVLLTDPVTSVGQSGLMVTESLDRSRATLAIAAPCVRAGVRYALCNSRIPSTDRGADLDLGTKITLRIRLLAFPCPTIQMLFDRWVEARRDRIGPFKPKPDLPLSACRRLIEDNLVQEQWVDVPGVFETRSATAAVTAAALVDATGTRGSTEAARSERESTFQTGADGALALVLPMLAGGTAEASARAAAVLDFQLRGQSSSGFFHGASDGKIWWDEGGGPPAATTSSGAGAGAGAASDGRGARGRRWTHVGRNAEALYLAAKQILLRERLEPSYQMPDSWRAGIGRCADAFVRLWNRSQQLGQYVATETGDIADGGSTAGAIAPAALVLAARVLDSDVYLHTALAASEAFYARFVQTGVTLGGAPAALQCPDSRSASGLLESFVTLAEVTGESIWFERAAEIAHQLASWTIAWDAPFPGDSSLGKLGARTTGAVLVSAQDKWGLPGFAGLSGDSLWRLYRATGQVGYLELLRETVHGSTQYVATRERRPEPEAKPGWVAGRIAMGDALGAPGDVAPRTPAGTAQATCLMMAAAIPSIYVHVDTGFLFVFDHVEARVREKTADHLRIAIRNPTPFDIELTIYSELEHDRSRPLGVFPLLGARSLTLAPGARENVDLAPP